MHRLFFKIWFAFFVTLLVSVGALYWVMDRGFKQEFYRYAARQALSSLHRLESQLVQDYRQQGTWEALRDNPRLWARSKYRAFDFRPARRADRARHQFQKPLAHYKRFIDSILLTDADKRPIVGRRQADLAYHWRVLEVDQQVVGYLGYVKPKQLLRDMDIDFLRKHIERLMLASIALLVLSSLVAVWVSRRIAVPIKSLSQNTRRLAEGDYEVQVPVRSLDEVGDLCRHFNELARRLEANQNMRNRWVADISHEMRTPVSVLKAQVEAMLDGVRPVNNEQLQVIATKIEGLRKLVDDLFELSLADAGSLTYRKEPVALTELVAKVVSAFRPLFAKKSLQFTLNNHLPDDYLVFADGKRLTQLLENLLENSLRYTDAGGSVALSLASENEQVLIALADSSPGVSEDQLTKIFERLYRAEASRSRDTGGAGLGLAICHNIVTAHDGQIWAERSEFGGLKVMIRLPLGGEGV